MAKLDVDGLPQSGVEATAEIRSRYEEIEIVVLTSFEEEEEEEEEEVHAAWAAGASGYLIKDADVDEVAGAIRAAHQGEIHLDPAIAKRLMASMRASKREDPGAELTGREREILRMVASGKAKRQIAAELVITERTARTHVSNILRRRQAARQPGADRTDCG